MGVGVLAGVLALAALPFLAVAPGRSRGQHRAPALPATPDREPRLGALPRRSLPGGLDVEMRSGTVPRTCTPPGRRSPLSCSPCSSSPPSPGPGSGGRASRRSSSAGARPHSSRSWRSGRCSHRSFSSGSPAVPLVAGRRGVRASLLLCAALVVTQLWFPYRYWDLVTRPRAPAVAPRAARDLLLSTRPVAQGKGTRSGSIAVASRGVALDERPLDLDPALRRLEPTGIPVRIR